MPAGSTGEPAREMFAAMLLIRRFEERLIELAAHGEFPGHYHVYIGQEGTGVGVCSQLGPDDVLFSNHRNHGHLLARGADPARMYAEILGRRDGYAGGKAGSFHLAVPDLNIPYTSAAVGGSVPLATGAALAVQRRAREAVVVCFIGDGVLEQGSFYESINIAALWHLPILYVCENNGIGTVSGIEKAYTSPSASLALPGLTRAPEAFGVESLVVDGRDVDAVSTAARSVVARIREGAGPCFMEARTNRWPGNRGTWPALVGGPTAFPDNAASGEATQPESNATTGWAADSDPLRLAFRRGVGEGWLSPASVAELDAEVTARIEDAVAWARSCDFPPVEQAFAHVVAGQER